MVFLISHSLGPGPIWVCLSCRAIQGAFELRHFSVALLASPSGSCPLIPLSSPIPLVRHLRAEASNSASGFLCKIAVRIACGAGKNHWLDSDWTNPTGYQPYIPLTVLLGHLQEIFDALIRTTASGSLGALSSLRICRHFDFLPVWVSPLLNTGKRDQKVIVSCISLYHIV